MRGIERMRDVLRLYVKTIDVIQPAVPRLRHHRQAPPVAGLVRRAVRDAPGNDSIARHADAVGVRYNDRTFEKSAFFDPRGAGHFAVAVQAKNPGVNRIVQRIVAARNDRGHTGAHRSFADFEFPFPADQGGKTDFDAGDVGDRVQLSWRAVEGNAESARANRWFRRRR